METTLSDIPTGTGAQSGADAVARAAELVPVLAANAPWADEHRRLHDETVTALTDAGLFRLRVPLRYGGLEADTATLVAVARELGRGDGSASWVVSTGWITSWMVGLFADEAQDDVFGASPDTRVCGTLSPGGMATTTEGGVVVNGKWGFISGAPHSTWQVIIAINPQPDGAPLPVLGLVPLADLQVVDDWHTSGLRGTGSITTIAQDVFVPQHRLLPLPAVLTEQFASRSNADSPAFRSPLLPTAAASSIGTALGLAVGAMDTFVDRLPGRKITYTAYAEQRTAPLTHRQVAEAALRIDAAGFHARRLTDLVDGKGAEGTGWKLEERVLARADMGRALELAKEAVDILASASGGSSIYTSVPIGRIQRDVTAMSLHALMNPDTNTELYGRVLCGLEPNTLYV